MNDIFQEILISLITGAISSLVFTSISYFAFLHKIPEKTYEKIEKLLNDRLGYETTNHNAVMGALNPNNEVLLNLVGKSVQDGTFEGKTKEYGIKEGASFLGTWSDKVPQNIIDEVMADQEKFKTGEYSLETVNKMIGKTN